MRHNEYPEDQEYIKFHGLKSNSVLDEDDEMELVTELLSVEDDSELDQFLGKLIRKVGRKVRRFAKSKVGRTLGKVFKKVTKIGLPLAGRVVGTYFGGPIGGKIGNLAGSGLSKAFGLELEGLSPEDQEFEIARQFVRFASEATQNTLMAPDLQNEEAVVKAAVVRAAKKYAPGLLGRMSDITSNNVRNSQGCWIRRGHNIILLGV